MKLTPQQREGLTAVVDVADPRGDHDVEVNPTASGTIAVTLWLPGDRPEFLGYVDVLGRISAPPKVLP